MSEGYVLTKVTVNGKDYFALDMPDKGWWIYPWQNYRIIVDDLDGYEFRVEYTGDKTGAVR